MKRPYPPKMPPHDNNHGDNERALFRTYLADLAEGVVAILGGRHDDGRRSGMVAALLVLAFSFCFWGTLAAYYFYQWFIK